MAGSSCVSGISLFDAAQGALLKAGGAKGSARDLENFSRSIHDGPVISLDADSRSGHL